MGYRKLATPPVLSWGLIAVAARLPIAMAPLALVFLVRETPGGYALGATLAGTYVVGEVVGALVVGVRPAARHRGALAAGLGVGAVAFAALSLSATAPAWVPIVLAFVAGAAPAASPGGMRTMLTKMVDEQDVPSALSAESVLTQIVWATAPALVVLLSLGVGANVPMLLAAAGAVVAAATLPLLPAPPTGQAPAAAGGGGRVLLAAWPVYLTSAAAMALLSTAELALTPLLEFRSLPIGWSGPLLTMFSVATAVGALIYGLRSWPGSLRAQSLWLLVGMAVCVGVAGTMPGLWGIAAFLVVAGVLQSGVVVTRNLTLRERLPEHAHTAGYSVMYAVQGVGYSVTATVTATVLIHFSAAAAIYGGALITLLLTGVSALAELRSRTPGAADKAGATA